MGNGICHRIGRGISLPTAIGNGAPQLWIPRRPRLWGERLQCCGHIPVV